MSPETSPSHRRRDPAATRSAIVTAAKDLILEVGTDNLTHRLVAKRAGVAVGSTTKCFATLDAKLSAEVEGYAQEIARDIDGHDDLAEAIVDHLERYLADKRLLRADNELTARAATDPTFRPIVQRYFDVTVDTLEPLIGSGRALAAAAFIDGIAWSTEIYGQPPEHELLIGAMNAIVNGPVDPGDRAGA